MHRNSSIQSEEITTLPPGLPLTIIGRSENSRWLEVQLSNGVTGWVGASFFAINPTIKIDKLFISYRTAAVPAALLTSGGDSNELVENLAQETIETIVQEALDAAAEAIKNAIPTRVPTRVSSGTGADTLTLPCVPGSIPPGYICVCNCV